MAQMVRRAFIAGRSTHSPGLPFPNSGPRQTWSLRFGEQRLGHVDWYGDSAHISGSYRALVGSARTYRLVPAWLREAGSRDRQYARGRRSGTRCRTAPAGSLVHLRLDGSALCFDRRNCGPATQRRSGSSRFGPPYRMHAIRSSRPFRDGMVGRSGRRNSSHCDSTTCAGTEPTSFSR
jgi:hypothetical protein